MSVAFDELQRGEAVLYAACDGIWVMTLFAPPTKADMLLARPALAAMAERERGGFPTLTWVLPEAGFRMDHDARSAAAEVTKAFESSIRAQATLIEGVGFQAAAVRAIITGLDAMSGGSSPKRVFSELPAAIAWCATRPGARAHGPTEEIAAALGRSRASLLASR